MITVKTANPQTPDIAALVAQLDRYQLSLYPDDSNHLVPIEQLAGENAHFVAAYDGPRPLGCGAIQYVRDDCYYGEIKRLFVCSEARGRGLSKEIMAGLEADARIRKAEAIRLETGIHQTEAINLYDRLGYTRRAPFGEYAEDPLSVFMEKRLSDRVAAEAS